jgi:ribosomal protein L28
MSRPQAVTPLLRRAGHPAILPIPRRSSGNNVPHSMTKTRRNWSPNTSKFNLPVNVLGGAAFVEPSIPAPGSSKFPRYPEFKNVKMAVKDLRTLDKNGGLEGMLVSC